MIMAAVLVLLLVVGYMSMGASAAPVPLLPNSAGAPGSPSAPSNSSVAPLGVPVASQKAGDYYSSTLNTTVTKDSAGKVSGTRFYAPSDSATSDVLVSGMNTAGCDGKFHYERTNKDGTIVYVTGSDLVPGQEAKRSMYNRADGSWICRGTDAGRSTHESTYYFDGRNMMSRVLNVTYL